MRKHSNKQLIYFHYRKECPGCWSWSCNQVRNQPKACLIMTSLVVAARRGVVIISLNLVLAAHSFSCF